VRLLGRRYHLVRREFRALPHGGDPPAARVRKVVITMGGSDPVGATARVLGAVPGRDLELCVVLGPGFRNQLALAPSAAAARRRGHRVTLVENPPSLAPILAGCDLAISAAGGTLAELAYLGRPTYAVAIVDDQIDLAARQAAAGLVAGGRPLTSLTNDGLTADLASLLADAVLRASLAAASAATIDGAGAARILAALT
jgi:spore coat polysaccharide biosynthesis predicted glycosyltransferase SpsG